MVFESIEEVQQSFSEAGYISDRSLATTVYLADSLKKPIFLEGEAGVGKTEVAKVMSKVLNTKLIRLQCYEGLDVNTSLYEWNYPKQMLAIRLAEPEDTLREQTEKVIFSQDFLLKRPLLEAIQNDGKPPVLLIDEIDRTNDEFEAFLLEILSDFQITIPEIGTIKAPTVPYVVLTSNHTREIHDALKRRCLYLWIDYPTFEKELQIVKTKVPGIEEKLNKQICSFMQLMRTRDFYKRPGIAETIDWGLALISLGISDLDSETTDATLGCIFKYQDDLQKIRQEGLPTIIDRVKITVGKENILGHAPIFSQGPANRTTRSD